MPERPAPTISTSRCSLGRPFAVKPGPFCQARQALNVMFLRFCAGVPPVGVKTKVTLTLSLPAGAFCAAAMPAFESFSGSQNLPAEPAVAFVVSRSLPEAVTTPGPDTFTLIFAEVPSCLIVCSQNLFEGVVQ